MKARFESRCLICDHSIDIGEDVWWSKGLGVWHQKCPVRLERFPVETIHLSRNDRPYSLYEMLRSKQDQWVTVIRSTWERTQDADGSYAFDFVGICRPALAEEVQFLSGLEALENAKDIQLALSSELSDFIQVHGVRCEAECRVDGERLLDSFDGDGVGEAFVVQPQKRIWYLRNDGDSDDESGQCCVRIWTDALVAGWFIDYSDEIRSRLDEIAALPKRLDERMYDLHERMLDARYEHMRKSWMRRREPE